LIVDSLMLPSNLELLSIVVDCDNTVRSPIS
jgi:hypothetical protein